MKEPKICCNCLHCARWKKKAGIECHCDLTDKYLGYLDVMNEDNNCKHWEKENKWDLQKKHDSELLDKVAEKIREHSGLHYVDCDGYFGGEEELIFKVDDYLDDIIAEMKSEVSE